MNGNIVNVLSQREFSSGRNFRRCIDAALEKSFFYSKEKHRANDLPLNDSVLSTIAISLSPDGETIATSHGDHTVKVFLFRQGKLLRVFHGHPRTPWTVKYHPSDSNIVASGCLGFEVRIWDIARNCCINMTRLEYSIISIAFHPSGQFIAIASGPQLHTWDWKEGMAASYGGYPIGQGPAPSRRMVVHSRNVRAVMFHPSGDFIFAAAPDPPRLPQSTFTPCRLYAFKFQDILDSSGGSHPIELWTMPAIVPQIHLYSDGGLDISQDGTCILTCAILYVAPSNLAVDANKALCASAVSPLSHRERSDADDDENLTINEAAISQARAALAHFASSNTLTLRTTDSPPQRDSAESASSSAPVAHALTPVLHSSLPQSHSGLVRISRQTNLAESADDRRVHFFNESTDTSSEMSTSVSGNYAVSLPEAKREDTSRTVAKAPLVGDFVRAKRSSTLPIARTDHQCNGETPAWRDVGAMDEDADDREGNVRNKNEQVSTGMEGSGIVAGGGRVHATDMKLSQAPASSLTPQERANDLALLRDMQMSENVVQMVVGNDSSTQQTASSLVFGASMHPLEQQQQHCQHHHHHHHQQQQQQQLTDTTSDIPPPLSLSGSIFGSPNTLPPPPFVPPVSVDSHLPVAPVTPPVYVPPLQPPSVGAIFVDGRRLSNFLPYTNNSAQRTYMAPPFLQPYPIMQRHSGAGSHSFGHIVTAPASSGSSGSTCGRGSTSSKRGLSAGYKRGEEGIDADGDEDVCGGSWTDSRVTGKILPIFADPRKGDRIPTGWKAEEHLCIFKLTVRDGSFLTPELVRYRPLTGLLMKAVTSAKLSPTGAFALVGYGVRNHGVVEDHPCRHVACEVMTVEKADLQTISVITDAEDEVNIAQFHPVCGYGVLYGTKRGKARVFRRHQFDDRFTDSQH